MSEAVYVRLDDEELDFIEKTAKESRITRSEAIKKLIDYAASKLKIERLINSYKEGRYTIRECAEIAGLRYFEFFEILSKENLLGTSPEYLDLLLSQIKNLKY